MRGWRGVRLLGVGVFVYRDRGVGGRGVRCCLQRLRAFCGSFLG